MVVATRNTEGLKRLIRDMSRNLKKWKSAGFEPGLSDLAAQTESWASDVSLLSYQTDLNTKGIQNAKAAIQSAWNSRDNRDIVVTKLAEACDALQSTEFEIEDAEPEYMPIAMRSSMKSMFGTHAGRHGYVTSTRADIRPIISNLEGVQAVKSVAAIDRKHLARAIEELDKFVYSRDGSREIAGLGRSALKMLRRAENFYHGNKDVIAKREIAKAIKTLQSIEHLSNWEDTSAEFQYDLSVQPKIVNALKAQIANITNMQAKTTFEAPNVFLPKFYSEVAKMKSIMGESVDGNVQRWINDALHHAVVSFKQVKHSAVKSGGLNDWSINNVGEQFDLALDAVRKIENHLGGIR